VAFVSAEYIVGIKRVSESNNRVSTLGFSLQTSCRGPQKILRDHWIGMEKMPASLGKSAIEYLQDVQKRLEVANEYVIAHTENE